MSAEVLTHNRFPPAAAARFCAELLNRHSPHEIACAIEVLIDLRDILDGDPDLEPEEDMGEEERGEQGGWGNGVDQRGLIAGAMAWHCDDCEDDDPAGQCDEDGINTVAPHNFRGPGCYISDPGEGEVTLP